MPLRSTRPYANRAVSGAAAPPAPAHPRPNPETLMAVTKPARALTTAVGLAVVGLVSLTGTAGSPPPAVEHQQAPVGAPGAMSPEELADAFRNGERGRPGGPLRIGPDGTVLP